VTPCQVAVLTQQVGAAGTFTQAVTAATASAAVQGIVYAGAWLLVTVQQVESSWLLEHACAEAVVWCRHVDTELRTGCEATPDLCSAAAAAAAAAGCRPALFRSFCPAAGAAPRRAARASACQSCLQPHAGCCSAGSEPAADAAVVSMSHVPFKSLYNVSACASR
jgi:hypothetical protein